MGELLVPALDWKTVGIPHLWLLWFCLWDEKIVLSQEKLEVICIQLAAAGGYHLEINCPLCSLSPVLQGRPVSLFGF